MMRQPLIRFRYAIEKARAAGASHPACKSNLSLLQATQGLKIRIRFKLTDLSPYQQ